MCGRFAFFSPKEAIERLFGVPIDIETSRRFNITPTRPVLALRAGGEGGDLAAVELRWGLVPFWAKDPRIGNRMINARLETLADKPAFRQALARRRCVVLADGFYEWQQGESGKTPFFISAVDGQPFGMAGLWERWDKGTEPLETCTIITRPAEGAMRELHDRMPAVLAPAESRLWIDPERSPAAALSSLDRMLPLRFWPVSRAVNNPRLDGVDLIAAIGR